MPAGIPVATMALDNSKNAAILALQIMAVGDEQMQKKIIKFKADLKTKIIKANEDLKKITFKFKTN